MKFFDYDSAFYKALRIISDTALICLLWLLTSLPLITIGASTTAAFYVMTRRISNMEYSILMDFFRSFKQNFPKATLVFCGILALSALNLFYIFFVRIPGTIGTVLFAFQFFFAVEMLFIYIHMFPFIARFDMPLIQLIKTVVLMANRHIIISLLHVIIIAGLALICILMPVLLLFAFGVYCLLSSYLLIKVYRKYRPDMDTEFPE